MEREDDDDGEFTSELRGIWGIGKEELCLFGGVVTAHKIGYVGFRE